MTQGQAPAAAPRPPRYKHALVTWLGVYPALTLTHRRSRPDDPIVDVPLELIIPSVARFRGDA